MRLHADEGHVRVSVRDNGVGFDTTVPRNSAHGLLGMRYRLETEGGTMRLESAPGEGTLIEAQLPEVIVPTAPSPAALPTDESFVA